MSPATPHSDRLTADELLSVVGNLVDELHPRRGRRFRIQALGYARIPMLLRVELKDSPNNPSLRLVDSPFDV